MFSIPQLHVLILCFCVSLKCNLCRIYFPTNTVFFSFMYGLWFCCCQSFCSRCSFSWCLIIFLICHISPLENRCHQFHFQGGSCCTEKGMDLPGFTKLVLRMTDYTSSMLGPRAGPFSFCFTLHTCQSLNPQWAYTVSPLPPTTSMG